MRGVRLSFSFRNSGRRIIAFATFSTMCWGGEPSSRRCPHHLCKATPRQSIIPKMVRRKPKGATSLKQSVTVRPSRRHRPPTQPAAGVPSAGSAADARLASHGRRKCPTRSANHSKDSGKAPCVKASQASQPGFPAWAAYKRKYESSSRTWSCSVPGCVDADTRWCWYAAEDAGKYSLGLARGAGRREHDGA